MNYADKLERERLEKGRRVLAWRRVRDVYEGAALRWLMFGWIVFSAGLVLINEAEYRVPVALLCGGVGMLALAVYFTVKAVLAHHNSDRYSIPMPPGWSDP